MGYTLNNQEVCSRITCASGLHDHKGAGNSTTDIIIEGIHSIIAKVQDLNTSDSAKEKTLVEGIKSILSKVENIDFTDLEQAIGEVKDAVANIDFSALAQETTLTQGIQYLKDVTAKENTLNSAKEEILTAVENIKLPEIDTTNIASKDLERFFGVKPIEGYEFMTAEEVCSTLEDIMTAMDLALTPQQAQEITNNTLTN